MTLSRRHFLTGSGALAFSTFHPSSARAGQRPFLYFLDDYIDPTKKLDHMNRFYLDTLAKLSIVHVWGYYCEPCIKEMPGLNRLYSQYQDKLTFISALDGIRILSAEDYARIHFKEQVSSLQQNAWPLFPTYVLDDPPTEKFLHLRVVPFNVLLKNGKFEKALAGKVPALREELEKIIRKS